ncbi:creatininase family protein [Humitalea sp. 24SJ18S-53]|uniref:creatininase family protein n=1 Tax=Humitalea sp. 24SJ18S-53 TaxID=3422307 RepID=UPI003D67F1F6
MRIDHVPTTHVTEYLTRHDTVLVPIGATECYGPHLAMGTELRLCEAYATQIGEKTGFAVTPIIPFNYSHMFLDYAGTCSANMETIESYVAQVCDGLAGQGFRHFFFINIHAGSLGPLESVCRRLRKDHGAVGGLIDVFSIMRDVAGVTYESKQAPTGHGGEMVTSAAMHVCPELVFMDQAKAPAALRAFTDGVKTVSSGKVALGKSSFMVFSDISDYSPLGIQGDPTFASAAKGAQIWDASLAYGVEAAERFSTMVLKA